MNFKEFLQNDLNEHINLVNNVLDFKAKGGIITKFGKFKDMKPYIKKVDSDVNAYSLYSQDSGITNAERTAILHQLKSQTNSIEYNKFLNNSQIYAQRILKPLKVDVIVTPISSSSLNKDFCDHLSKRLNCDFYVESFKKSPINKIEIDFENPKITTRIKEYLTKILQKAEETGRFQLSKVPVKDRVFLKNIFEVSDDKLLTKFQNKNVLIVDDFVSSGATTKNIQDVLFLHGQNSVNQLTLIKNQS